jgi:hypothetical protein
MSLTSWFTTEGSAVVAHPFIKIEGDLLPASDRPERVIYPGTDGVGYYFNGLRGQPFGIKSICDFATQAAAETEWANYLARVGGKLDLHYLGTLWGTVGILDVTMNSIKRCATTVGGINVASGSTSFLLSASWQIETLAP